MSSKAPAPAAIPADHVAFEFEAPGLPDQDSPMQLEVVAQLPAGAGVWLEAPLAFLGAMHELSPFMKSDERRDLGWLPVNPHGRRRLGAAVFPARSRTRLRLLVHVRRQHRKDNYEVYVRQLWRGEEVGRVTWRLAGDRKGRKH
jgi:serine protease